VVVDLSDDWTPYIFAQQLAADGQPLPNRYRRIFVGEANDQLDNDGEALQQVVGLNAVNLAFVAFSRAAGTLDGQVLVFFVMVVAAAEAAVGLAIVIALQRGKDTLDLDAFNLMKW